MQLRVTTGIWPRRVSKCGSLCSSFVSVFYRQPNNYNKVFVFKIQCNHRYKEASIEYHFSGEKMESRNCASKKLELINSTMFHMKGHSLGFCDETIRRFVFSFLKNGLPFYAMIFTITND